MYLLASYFAARSASLALSFLPYESLRFFLLPVSFSSRVAGRAYPRRPDRCDPRAAATSDDYRLESIRETFDASCRDIFRERIKATFTCSRDGITITDRFTEETARRRASSDISHVSLTGNHVIPRCYLLASADASRFFHYRNVFSTRARANGKVGGASRTFFERQFASHRERVRDTTGRTNELRRMREKTFRPTNERTRQRARATTRNSCEDA